MLDIHTNHTQAKLGFGCMRLPLHNQYDESSIDLKNFTAMVDLFLSEGFTYFDTARGYHEGSSEGALKRALVERYPRDSFHLASKLPAYLAQDAAAAKEMFFTSLEDTGAGYFDSFLLHNLGGYRTTVAEEYGIWGFLEEQRHQGLIDRIGFSFHGYADELEYILAHHDVDFVQLQINYADWESETIQSRACYELARSCGLPIVVMEPLKGGLLADPPQEVSQIFTAGEYACSPVEWAFRFVASLEGVDTILSGMSNIQQMEDNIAIMKTLGKMEPEDRLDYKRKERIEAARHMLEQRSPLSCTSCGYCLEVCPQGVRVPAILRALNILGVYQDVRKAQESYLWALEGKASCCIACGACEKVCPQHLGIVGELKKARLLIEEA